MHLKEALEKAGYGRYQQWLLLLSGLGYASGTMELVNITLLVPELKKAIEDGSLPLGFNGESSQALQGLLGTVTFIGHMIGAFGWGFISDRYGRRIVFVYVLPLAFALSFGSSFAPSFVAFLIFRFILGITLGGNMSLDLVMYLENVPASWKNRSSAVVIAFGVLGVILNGAIGYFTLPTLGWRYFAMFTSLPIGLTALLRLFWKWDSPDFLVSAGRLDEAAKVVEKMARLNGNQFDYDLTLEPVEVLDSDVKVSNRSLAIKLALLFALWFFVAFAYYGLTFWLSVFLELKGIKPIGQYTNMIYIGASQLPGLVFVVLLLEQIHRKYVATVGLVACAISTLVFGLATSETAAIVSTCAIYFFIVGTWYSVYLMTPDTFPVKVRNITFAICTMGATISASVAGPFGGYLLDRQVDSWYILLMFVVSFLIGAFLVLLINFERKPIVQDELEPLIQEEL